MKQKGVVGIVGLGIMGGAFAHNLHAAGWPVIGYDLDPKRRRALGRAGIAIAADVGALAAEAPVIIQACRKRPRSPRRSPRLPAPACRAAS